jgi:hypothetical protein
VGGNTVQGYFAMRTIHKSIVTDEAMRPIAVQIGYADWIEIEQSLGLADKASRTIDPSRFAGVISLTEDPLVFQNRIRGEWQ